MILAGNVLELGVRVGDCDKARAGALGTQVSADVLPAHVREHGWLERGSRLARHDVERACRVRRSEDVIDVDRRERVHRLERDLVSDFEAVELGDRLRGLRRAALTDEDDGIETFASRLLRDDGYL